ncbi:MAG: protein kinase [Myxococcota bacterium]|jgi:serine/threonine protein kinase/tetratricopeptide (TPR) repeat protein|nr:protein kinase [Myxococcota bacterium]
MESIGRYTVIRQIGSGGMAEVFLARSPHAQGTEKLLVIKKIHPALARNAKFIDMFVDEARVAMRLNHTNIVQTYSFEQLGETYLIAMEYVDGFDLLEIEGAARQRDRKMPAGLAAYIAAEVARGLDYAHSRRDDRGEPLEIVHRDVSPQNILLSRDGAVKITDFGIARARWLGETDTSLQGKFGYMAPEQAALGSLDRRTDVFALGVVLWEMLVGRPLLKARAGEDMLHLVRRADYPRAIEADPSVPPALDEIVRTAMAPLPADRFPTAREMAQELSRFLHSLDDLCDSQSLESWIEEIAPGAQPTSIEPEPVTETVTRSPATKPHLSSARLGEVELRPAVLVSGRYEADPHPARQDITATLQRLIGEMAYKAEAVVRHLPAGFDLFLGLSNVSPEDAVSGLRLASDVLDATRALALDHRLRIRVKVAVTRGMVRCHGDDESELPRFIADSELEVRARGVLDASRAGEVVADGRVYRLARRDYNFEEVPANVGTYVEGGVFDPSTGQGCVYRVVGAKSRLDRSLEERARGSFFGRQQELDRLRQALSAASGGHLLLLRLVGDIGVGKSRLLSHFLATSAERGTRLVHVEALFAERAKPLATASAVVRSLLGIPEGSLSEARLRERVFSILSGAPEYAERQQAFFTSFLEAPQDLWARSGATRRELIRRAAFGMGVMFTFLARRETLIIAVDNAQWMDAQSIDVLSELARQRAALGMLVLLVGQRSTLAGRHISGLSTLSLDELPESAMRELVRDRLGAFEDLEELKGQIVTRAAGNPFFASEIIDSLIEQRFLVQTNEGGKTRFRQSGTGEVPLPSTVEGITTSRIDKLSHGQRTVLRAASALGASFDAETVGALVGHDVSAEIATLVEQGFLVEMPSEAGRAFRFRQPVLREAAYAGLAQQDRRRIHTVLADELILADQRGKSVSPVQIAWHLEGKGEREAAGQYYLKAAGEALEVYSSREAVRLYALALPLLEPMSKAAFEARSRKERVLRDLGRFEDRQAELARMRGIAVELGDDTLLARCALVEAQLGYDSGEFVEAAESLRLALELAALTFDSAVQIEALRLLAYVAVEQGHLIRALDCAKRAIALCAAEDAAAAYRRARALGIKGFVMLNMGHLSEAALPLAEALVVFRNLGKRRNESQVMSNLALLAQARGELGHAIEFLENAMRIDGLVRDTSARGRKLAALGRIRTELGDFDTARANLDDGRAICRENRETVGEVEADLGLAELLLELDQAAAAREILEAAGRGGVVSRSRLLLVWHRQIAAMALMKTGLPNAGLRLADEAARIALESGMNGEAVRSNALFGLLLSQADQPGKAQSAARRALELLDGLGQVRRAEEVHLWLAKTFEASRSPYRAAAALEAARAEVRRKASLIPDRTALKLYLSSPMVCEISASEDK